ncbi:MAG: hypothetical protein V2I32_12330 [Desulforhopalus sp.]|jgi:hypothetical protein|nr:hypothetical protein [Desulforhopalus sp.]
MPASKPHETKELPFSLVEIKLNEIRQLFNSFDPAPFRQKDLAAGAEDYIVDSVQELPLDAPIKLLLHLPAASCSDEAAGNAASAIHNYFAYRADITGKELRFTLQQGRTALLIGLVFLLACLSAQHLIAAMGKTGLFWLFIKEGVLISGWVAMWRPIDVFLYAWWPIRRRRRTYQKLATMPIELRPY